MATSSFQRVLSVLRKQEGTLESQLRKVRDAITALSGSAVRSYRRRQRVRRVKSVVKNVRKVTAAQRKAASARMKKYWANRRKRQAK
jgi:hypothetical protein